MSRKAPIITLDELKAKLHKYIHADDETLESFPYGLPSKVLESDLAKIEFDFENWAIGNADPMFEKYPNDCKSIVDYPCGYLILPSGIPVLMGVAGGDWEYPVCFALYFDSKGIRGYVPTDGNVYNKKTKMAYGNEDDELSDEFMKSLDSQVNSESIINDINNRIQVK